MILNLNELTLEQSKLKAKLKKNVIADYNALTEQLIDYNRDSLEWLVCNVNSRSTVFSSMLAELESLRLISELISSGEIIEEIIVDNDELRKTISNLYPKINVHGKTSSLKNNIRLWKNNIRYGIWSLCSWLSGSKERRNKVCRGGRLTIIDTFIAKKVDAYWDRFYGNSVDKLIDAQKEQIYFMPLYLPFASKKQLDIIVANSKENLFFMSDFLLFKDYLYAWRYMGRFEKPDFASYTYQGFSLQWLLGKAYKESNQSYFYYAILMERAIMRMKELDVDICLFVDWFENQSYDKSVYYAMHQYYPEAKVHGYMGFIADSTIFPHIIASNKELFCHIAPKDIYLCSSYLLKFYQNYNGYKHIAPALRNHEIYSSHRSTKPHDKFTLLVPFALDNYDMEYKYELLTDFIKSSNANINILLKPHPDANSSWMVSCTNKAGGKLEVVKGNVNSFLLKADAILAANTSVMFEALSLGIPVINLKDPLSIILFDKIEEVNEVLWYTANNLAELSDAIVRILNLNIEDAMTEGYRLRNYFFTKLEPQLIFQLFT